MPTKTCALLLVILTLLLTALFLPWTGILSIARACQESAAFLATVGSSAQAWVAVGLTGLLALFPIHQTASTGIRLAFRKPVRRIWTPAWLISLSALALFPFILALGTGAFLGLHLSWGYWLYGAGMLAAGLIGATGQKRRLAVLVLLGVAPLALGFASALRYPWPQTVALINATLIDGTGRAPVNGTVVVIRGGKIAAVGTKETVTIPGVRGRSICKGPRCCLASSTRMCTTPTRPAICAAGRAAGSPACATWARRCPYFSL